MGLPNIVSREVWLERRRALLAEEKALTRARDKLSAARREMPMVRIDKAYRFEGAEGIVTLADLFKGKSQLVVIHFMFAPDWEEGCPSCSAGADEMSPGLIKHLESRDTALAYVSRAPYAKLAAFREKKGWRFPWYSAIGDDFNLDFGVTLDEAKAPIAYNYKSLAEHRAAGTGYYFEGSDGPMEMPGLSAFLQDDGAVYHTYSTYGRGMEATGGSYYFLDLTALGRQEAWEEPKGRVAKPRDSVPDFSE